MRIYSYIKKKQVRKLLSPDLLALLRGTWRIRTAVRGFADR